MFYADFKDLTDLQLIRHSYLRQNFRRSISQNPYLVGLLMEKLKRISSFVIIIQSFLIFRSA